MLQVTTKVQRLVVPCTLDPVERLVNLLDGRHERSAERLLSLILRENRVVNRNRVILDFWNCTLGTPALRLSQAHDAAHLDSRLRRVHGALEPPVCARIGIQAKVSRGRVREKHKRKCRGESGVSGYSLYGRTLGSWPHTTSHHHPRSRGSRSVPYPGGCARRLARGSRPRARMSMMKTPRTTAASA